MKNHIIYTLIALVLIIIFLTVYTVVSAKTPIIRKLIQVDKDSITYKVRNISPVNFYYGMGDNLQYKENNKWVNVETKENYAVQSVLLRLSGFGMGNDEFKTNLKGAYGELKSGEYRIEKIFFREEKGKSRMEYKLYIYFGL